MSLEELLKQKAELEALIEVERKKEEEEKRINLIKNTPINITNIEITQDGQIYFKSNYREDFITYLRTIPSRSWNGTSNSVSIKDWHLIQDCPLDNFHIALSEEELASIKEWKPPPTFKIEIDDRGFQVFPSNRAPKHLMYAIPGAEYKSTKDSFFFRIALAEGWRIFDTLKDLENVVWSDEALEYCTRLIEQRKLLDEIASLEDYPLQLDLNGEKLKPFQNVGVRFSQLADFNVILGDEMGLGKTAQALACTLLLDEKYGATTKHLLICPAALKSNLVRAVKKFTGHDSYEMFGSVPTSVDMIQILKGDYKYYIANYDIVASSAEEKKSYKDEQGYQHNSTRIRRPWIELFNLAPFKSVIIDEGHKIKNISSKRSQAIREIKIPHKIILTGTPLINRPGELWPLINFINPTLVGSYESFVRRYTIDSKTARNVDELREILKPIMIRRRTKEVLKDLPPINRITEYVDLSPAAKTVYNKALEGLWTDFDSWDGNLGNTQIITSLLAQIMKLKQICAHDKVPYIADKASDIHESLSEVEQNKVLIFTQFVNSPPCIEDIAVRLRDQGSLIITGEIHPNDRIGIVDKFQQDNDEYNFLVCSTTAASEGLNITKAGAVIFNDLMWTPAAHAQAEGRAYGRLNDPHSISSYYVICKGTIEEDIMELLAAKLNIFNEIIEGTEASRDTSIAMELLDRLKNKRRVS